MQDKQCYVSYTVCLDKTVKNVALNGRFERKYFLRRKV